MEQTQSLSGHQSVALRMARYAPVYAGILGLVVAVYSVAAVLQPEIAELLSDRDRILAIVMSFATLTSIANVVALFWFIRKQSRFEELEEALSKRDELKSDMRSQFEQMMHQEQIRREQTNKSPGKN